MATYPGTPDLFVELNQPTSSGPTSGGTFQVKDATATYLTVESSGAGRGNLTLAGDLMFQTTSAPKSVEATSGLLSLIGGQVRIGDPINYLEVEYDGALAEMKAASTTKLAVLGNEVRLSATGSGPGHALLRVQDGAVFRKEDRLIISQDTTSGEVTLEAASTPTPLGLRLSPGAGQGIVLTGGPTRVTDALTVQSGE